MITLFEQISQVLGLPAGLLAAMCSVESGHNPNAIHPADHGRSSFGMCQVKFKTAQDVMPSLLISDLFKPDVNVTAAALVLKKKLDKYKTVSEALASYNAGHVKYKDDGSIKNMQYVRKVLKEWKIQKRALSLSKVGL